MRKIILVFVLTFTILLISCGSSDTQESKSLNENLTSESANTDIITGHSLRNLDDNVSFSIPNSWESKEFSIESGYIYLLENKYDETYSSAKDIDFNNISEYVSWGSIWNPDQDDSLTGEKNLQGIIDKIYPNKDYTTIEFTTINNYDVAIVKSTDGKENEFENIHYLFDYMPQTAIDCLVTRNIYASPKHTDEIEEVINSIVINK